MPVLSRIPVMRQAPVYDACNHDDKTTVTVMKFHLFPSPHNADAQGCLCYSDTLTADLAFSAHCQGIFPWYNEDTPVLWWSPDPRCIIRTDAVHVSRSLQKQLRRMPYRLTLDRAFEEVVAHCAGLHGTTWINDDIAAVYGQLHRQHRAHSCELWQGDALVGGLYGVALERIFCGESMFSLIPSASKIVLVRLCAYLARIGIEILDTQFMTEHLHRMGAVNISRAQYLSFLTACPDTHRRQWQLPDSLSVAGIL